MTEKMIRDAYCRIRTIDQTIPDDVLDFMKDAALEKLRKHVQEIKDASPSRHQEGDMKTAEEILSEEMGISFTYKHPPRIIKAMKAYAQSVAEQALKDATGRAVTFIPTHSHLHGIKAVDKQSILDTEIKLP